MKKAKAKSAAPDPCEEKPFFEKLPDGGFRVGRFTFAHVNINTFACVDLPGITLRKTPPSMWTGFLGGVRYGDTYDNQELAIDGMRDALLEHGNAVMRAAARMCQ